MGRVFHTRSKRLQEMKRCPGEAGPGNHRCVGAHRGQGQFDTDAPGVVFRTGPFSPGSQRRYGHSRRTRPLILALSRPLPAGFVFAHRSGFFEDSTAGGKARRDRRERLEPGGGWVRWERVRGRSAAERRLPAARPVGPGRSRPVVRCLNTVEVADGIR